MATAVVKAVRELEAAEVELLRQKVIVHLLRESSWQPQAVAEYVKELIQHQVLTHEVCEEVRALLIEKGLGNLGCRGGDGATKAKAGDRNVGAIPHPPAGAAAAATVASSPSEGLSSSRFDREFERLEMLGRGAFGEVWRARSRVDHKEYAVKMVPYRFNQEDGPFQHPALREAQAWADFQHPNAVRYHASWVEVDGEGDAAPTGEGKMLPMPPLAEASTEDASADGPLGDLSLGSTSSGANSDDSDGGVVFEASERGDAGPAAQTPQPAEMRIIRREATKTAQDHRATLFLQSELVHGGTLREWIDKRNTAIASGSVDAVGQQMSSKAAEEIFRQIVDAVTTMHSQGMVHRDIKPANILLTESGGVRLGDFGLAKSAGNETSALGQAGGFDVVDTAALELAATTPGSSPHTRGVGTPTYASPEQMRSDARYGTEVDVYALGMVLAELLVPVQTQMERAQLLEGVRANQLPPNADALCAGAGEVVLKMTSLDPQKRPSALELAALLRQRATQQGMPMTCPCEADSVVKDGSNCESMCIAAA